MTRCYSSGQIEKVIHNQNANFSLEQCIIPNEIRNAMRNNLSIFHSIIMRR